MKKLFFLILIIFLLAPVGCKDKPGSGEIRVMTLNLRYDNPADSINAWPFRADLVCRFIKDEKPDLLGMQEVLLRQYEVLDSALTDYASVGVGRNDGAKGGEIYVLGNAAGRPMINAVGSPRVVINGTALDFLAESFMAGDPHNGGGFAIVNGLQYDHYGKLHPLELPYPGSNLLSLASGGAIYVRDPHHTLIEEQLNGGAYRPLSPADWRLILPYLQENERLFGISIERDLLTVDGILTSPQMVYRKVLPRKDAEAEAEMEGQGE